jgi:4'-phosphopantetheinyl transferase
VCGRLCAVPDPQDEPEAPLAVPALAEAEAHVWLVDLTGAHSGSATLSAVERDRATTIGDPEARRRFTATRTAVRRVLGGYLDVPPSAVPLRQRCPDCAGPHGRPEVLSVSRPLVLSISHSGDLAAIAVARSGDVGVDVERGGPHLRPARIADRRFARDEAAYVRSAPDEAGTTARFLRIWTRKEAYLKATGAGLTRPMSSFAVSGTDPAALLRVVGDDAARWSLVDLPLPDGMAGAVALPARHTVRILELTAFTSG